MFDDMDDYVLCCEHCGENIAYDEFLVDQDSGLLHCPECGESQTEGR